MSIRMVLIQSFEFGSMGFICDLEFGACNFLNANSVITPVSQPDTHKSPKIGLDHQCKGLIVIATIISNDNVIL